MVSLLVSILKFSSVTILQTCSKFLCFGKKFVMLWSRSLSLHSTLTSSVIVKSSENVLQSTGISNFFSEFQNSNANLIMKSLFPRGLISFKHF